MNQRFKFFATLALLAVGIFSASAQSSRLVSFFTNTTTIRVAFYADSSDNPEDLPDLYDANDAGIVRLLTPSSVERDGKRVVMVYTDLKYKNSHKFGDEFRLYLPLKQEISGLTISGASKEAICLEEPYPDKPIAIKGLEKLGPIEGVSPSKAPVNQLEMAFDTKIIDAKKDCAKGALVCYTVKNGETVETVIKNVRTKAHLNQSANYPSVRQRRDRRLYEWNYRHAMILERNKRINPNVILIGDSITHYWGDQAGCYLDFGREFFDEVFEGWRPTNLGYGWDRIENMMWRIDHGEMDGYKAEHIFIMAGTNNISAKLSEEQLTRIAGGIVELVELIRVKQPKAKIHVVRIYPRRNTEKAITFVNDIVVGKVSTMKNVDVVSVDEVLADENGMTITSLYSDGTHPNTEGYKRVAEVYKKYISR